MRQSDAPTPEPSRVLPHGDGDGCNGCLILPFHSGSTVGDSDDPIIRIDDNAAFYRGARNHETATDDISKLCLWSSPRDCPGHDDKAIG